MLKIEYIHIKLKIYAKYEIETKSKRLNAWKSPTSLHHICYSLCTIDCFAIEQLCCLLISVPFCNQEVHEKVDEAEHGEEPVEVVQMSSVQVIGNPSEVPILGSNVGDNCYE